MTDTAKKVMKLDELKNGEQFYVVFPDGTIGSRLAYERVTGDPKGTAKRTDTGVMRPFSLDMRVVRVSREADNTLTPTIENSAPAVPRPYESPLTSCL